LRRLAFELARDIEQIARVEADLERRRIVFSADLFGGAAAFGVVDREYQLVGAYVELDRAAPLAGDGGYAVDRALVVGI